MVVGGANGTSSNHGNVIGQQLQLPLTAPPRIAPKAISSKPLAATAPGDAVRFSLGVTGLIEIVRDRLILAICGAPQTALPTAPRTAPRLV